MSEYKEEARPAGGTAERAKRESHRRGGNPCVQNSTERGGGQGAISRLLMEGSENGLHLQDLVRLTGWPERDVRKAIQAERKHGTPILSDNVNGYFLPGNDQEREACIRSLRGRAREILAAAEAIERAEV